MTRQQNFLSLLFAISALLLAGCSGDDSGDKESGRIDYPVVVSGILDAYDPDTGGMVPGAGTVKLEILNSQGSLLDTETAQADQDGRWVFPERMLEPLEVYRISVSVPDHFQLAPGSVQYFYGEKFGDEELADISNAGIEIELMPSAGIAYLEYSGEVGENDSDFPDAEPGDAVYRMHAFWPGIDEFAESLSGKTCTSFVRNIVMYSSEGTMITGGTASSTDSDACHAIVDMEIEITLPPDALDSGILEGANWDSFLQVHDQDSQEFVNYSELVRTFYVDETFYQPQASNK